MYKRGDIVFVNRYLNALGEEISWHPFLVLSSKKGKTNGGKDFDFVALEMSSLTNKSEENIEKKISRFENYVVTADEEVMSSGAKDAIVKANQVYFMQEDIFRLDQRLLGTMETTAVNNIEKRMINLIRSGKSFNNTYNAGVYSNSDKQVYSTAVH